MTAQSVGDAFPGELARCRELVKAYEEIGGPGFFGKTMIQQTITRAERALASGDVVAIVQSYAEMRGCE